MSQFNPINGDRHEIITAEKRDVIINGKVEFLPGDPREIAMILRERSKSPAARAKAKIVKDLKRRGY